MDIILKHGVKKAQVEKEQKTGVLQWHAKNKH